MKSSLINIETEDRNLDDLIVREYSGKIFEKNRRVKEGKRKTYIFLGLEKEKFEELISSSDIYSYGITPFLGQKNYFS